MPIAAAFAGSAAVDCCGNAARSWSDEINICTMRRVHLRGGENILKRLVVHSGAANLGLLMRKLFGKGTPRGLAEALPAVISTVCASIRLWPVTATLVRRFGESMARANPTQIITVVA